MIMNKWNGLIHRHLIHHQLTISIYCEINPLYMNLTMVFGLRQELSPYVHHRIAPGSAHGVMVTHFVELMDSFGTQNHHRTMWD